MSTDRSFLFREIIIDGYLTESTPGEPRHSKLGKLLQELHCVRGSSETEHVRWQKRYCVLYKIRRQNATVTLFDYYKDATCSKLKGRVDLENCDCITDNARVDGWSNVFSIQTQTNGTTRIHYFSAASLDIMSEWVQKLVRIVGLVNTSSIDPVTLNFPKSSSATSNPLSRRPTNGTSIPAGIVTTPTWLPDPQLENGYNPSWVEDGYRDPTLTGAEYLMAGPEDEGDDYNRLPGSNHSYVNLANQVSGSNDTDEPANDYVKQSPSLASSKGFQLTLDKSKEEPNTSKTNGKPDSDSEAKPSQLDERRNSTSSVYYNVWEAGLVSTDTPQSAGQAMPVVTKCTSQPAAPSRPAPSLIKRSTVTKTRTTTTTNSPAPRVYRRSQLVTDYYALPQLPKPSQLSNTPPNQDSFPISCPPTTTAPTTSSSGTATGITTSAMTATTITTTTRTAPSVTSYAGTISPRAPMPPPRAATTRVSSATLPFSSATSRVPPMSDLTSTPLGDMCSDVALPIRAPGSRLNADSSMDSNSDSNSSLDSLDKDDTADLHSSTLKNPDNSTLPSKDMSKLVKKEASFSKSSDSRPVNQTSSNVTLKESVSKPSRTSQQLNYIEPCNLDLGTAQQTTASAIATCTTTITTTSTTNTNNNIPNLFNPERPVNLSTNQKSTPTSSITTSDPIIQMTSIAHASAPLCPPRSGPWPSTKVADDYQIEYREIDPISTNALAIVTKQYLDDSPVS